MKNYKIAVAGTGYVGLSLSVLLAQHNQVTAVDIVQAKVDMINNHRSPIQDDYIEKYLAEKELNLTATLDAKSACCENQTGFGQCSVSDGWYRSEVQLYPESAGLYAGAGAYEQPAAGK